MNRTVVRLIQVLGKRLDEDWLGKLAKAQANGMIMTSELGDVVA
jgi:hypothetical protein